VLFPLRDHVVLLSAVKIAMEPRILTSGLSRPMLWNVAAFTQILY
jgi:hypothetical protein